MAKKKTTNLYERFRVKESYTSLIIGIVVVIIASILLISFVRNREALDINKPSDVPDISSTRTGPGGEYVVKEGETLFTIAERELGDGSKVSEIVELNKLSNPDMIEAGTTIMLPSIDSDSSTAMESGAEPTASPTSEPDDSMTSDDVKFTDPDKNQISDSTKVSGKTHNIIKGDTLWSISERYYGDGFQYMKIAKANNIANPNLIYAGSTIQIP